MSSALINDYPITFLPHLAKAIGVNEALVLQQLHYWLVNHAEVQHEGKFWIYKTYEEWQEQDFFFWSVRTVKSVFKSLILRIELFIQALEDWIWKKIYQYLVRLKIFNSILIIKNRQNSVVFKT